MKMTKLTVVAIVAAFSLGSIVNVSGCREHLEPEPGIINPDGNDEPVDNAYECFQQNMVCGLLGGFNCGTCPDDEPLCSGGQCLAWPFMSDDPDDVDLCDFYDLQCGPIGPQFCGKCEEPDGLPNEISVLCNAGECKEVGAEYPLPPEDQNPCILHDLECGVIGIYNCGVCDPSDPDHNWCESATHMCIPAPDDLTPDDLYYYANFCEIHALDCGSHGLDFCGVCDPDSVNNWCTEDGQCVPNPYITCQPSCLGKVCGYDGCGGSCGTCPHGHACQGGQCICIPDCNGSECGDDGCGGSCGTCENDEYCAYGQCESGPCVPDCQNKICGDNGCGGSCGTCAPGHACADGQCVCQPNCMGKVCGDDGCGGSCGACDANQYCVNGNCEDECTPDCAGKECGPDGCGGTCGSCAPGQACVNGFCSDCVPNCAGKECGPDGCGSSCGTCAAGHLCDAGMCECQPNCVGKECGDDGCGGSCGTCNNDETCTGGTCVDDTPPCVPDCIGMECGPDGCGGSCGTCGADEDCMNGQCVGEECDPDCTGKECGPNGCGGSCGTCAGNENCVNGQCQDGPCAPDCQGKICGDDGCGGTCGSCGGNTVCNPAGTKCLQEVTLCFALKGAVVDYTFSEMGDDPLGDYQWEPVNGAPGASSPCVTYTVSEVDPDTNMAVVAITADADSPSNGFVFVADYADPDFFLSGKKLGSNSAWPPPPPLFPVCDPAKTATTYTVTPGQTVVISAGCPTN